MKEVIYSIPINDAYDVKCGCPICRIEKKLEKEALEYVMGAAMMEPDVRIQTNKLGFCSKHYEAMLTMKNRLSLALMLQSYLNEMLDYGVVSYAAYANKKDFEEITTKICDATTNCYVCNRIEEILARYIDNTVFMWKSEQEFRNKTKEQEYFCPRHLGMLLSVAKKGVSKRDYGDFCNDHFVGTRKKLTALADEVTKFCNSYNYLNRNVPLGDAKNAVEHAIDFLTGVTTAE